MDDIELRLDGNALAGVLQELFAADATAASGTCGNCGRVAQLGAQHLYRFPHAPGAVLRCSACDAVLLVLTQGPHGNRLTMLGLSWFEFGRRGSSRGE